jgi:malonyl CoA-acyl carrier protein transacylase
MAWQHQFTMAKIFLFPGQGSQSLGMGKDLFPRFREEVAAADEILGYSIEDLCLQGPEEKLNLTQHTQPALYVVNALTWKQKLEDGGEAPAFTAGHSLGEYNALLAAGVFDFATGLRLVRERGRLMGEARDGGMAAVVGLSRETIESVLGDNGLESLDIANLNAPDQTVLSGPKADIEKAKPIFEQAKARMYVPLKVSAAFHSRYMTPAAESFARFLEEFTFSTPSIPVIANVSARPYGNDDATGNLAGQINGPVRWTESMNYLLEQAPDGEFEETGPGKVLAGLLRKIKAARG